jgi:Domain of unknown function (DUF3943)
MAVLKRCTAMVGVLCIDLGVVPAFAEETPFALHPDAEQTPFFLLSDWALGSLDTEATERKGRDWVGLGRDTLFLLGYQVAFIGILYALPESVSRWSDDQKKISFENWWNNVQHPVTLDKDNPLGNYVGHPYIGATYYTRARERGFGKIDSFLYSALASAMFEFGPEAVFERPSYQDLVVTPVGGALLGLAFEPLRNWVKRKPEPNWYGHAILIATDPIGALNSLFEPLIGIKSDIRVDVGRDSKFHVELRMRWN